MVEVSAATHPGKVRQENEDFFYHGPIPQGYVVIVCDGMGGHAAGEVAARIAAETIYQFLQEAPPTPPEDLLKDALLAAHHRILLYAQANPHHKNLGSTAVVVLITPQEVLHAHVGDSRLYLYNKGQLSLLTHDDSLVQELLRGGLISPEQALHHPQKNVLSQCLGQSQGTPEPHVAKCPLPRKGIFLLCTDGFSNALSQEEIIDILADNTLNLAQKAEKLVEQAVAQAGYDNTTVLLVCPPTKTATFAGKMNLKLPPQKYLIAGAIALAVMLIGIWVFARKSAASSTPPTDGQMIILSDSTAADADTTAALSAPEPETQEEVSPPMPLPATPTPPPSEPSVPKVSSSPPKSSPISGTYFPYTIQKGDNLTQIAKAFSLSKEELRKANNLKDDNIQAGKKLKIPVKSVHTHTVGKGETLSAIARKYATTVEAIKRANQLEDEKIRLGQKLTVPVVKK
ncbi:MAG: LysM peptidoglycan-binding domain-containing protein [Bacteroidia bacterium]|jgi:protein phosphatase|nr:LysM peptidoglycan-binding domain-containing protein [Bacteroidia bacterium]GIV22612.1 MAG: hypothetical protein KatS3mg025_0271 [Bacteroidia bacterium]